MPQLRWDETDVLGYLEAIPDIEEYEVSHSYFVQGNEISLKLQIWQLESVAQITLLYPDDSTLLECVIFIHGEVEWVKGKNEHLLFRRCYLAPSRFSYMCDRSLSKGDDQGRELNVEIRIKPKISIVLVEIGNI